MYMKISFVGPFAVGKDAVSSYIEKKYNLTHISSGNIIRDYITKNNLGGLDRKNLQIVANKMRVDGGGDILVKMALAEAKDNVIVSGLRAIDEVETFKKMGGNIIAITAPIEQRYKLAQMRGRVDDHISFEEFKKIEEEENKSKDHNEQNLSKVIAMADFEVINDGSLEELFAKCDKTISQIMNGF